ncbi:MAG TPA: ribosome silencing factor [Terriglobales bacterium]|jgi:ribosome-associated protein|nr:ribosome silencing factor [Terriglobales bacterium]
MRANTALRQQVAAAIQACEDKKAANISVLEMDKNAGAFTDYFVICSGSNPRQIQAIADDIRERLHAMTFAPKSVEGYNQAEWVLMDYVDFVVHIFSEHSRRFYDLERLWKSAKRLTPAEVLTPAKRVIAKKKSTATAVAPKRKPAVSKNKSASARKKAKPSHKKKS